MPSCPSHPAPERRPAADGLRPAAAERARTVATRAAATVCARGVEGGRLLAHTVTRAGQVLLVVPADGDLLSAVRAAPDQDLSALVMISDHAPVALRRPVRAQLWLSGWATPVGPADRRAAVLAFAEVVLGEGGEGIDVSPQEFAAAAPDLLAGIEPDHLRHLATDHADVLDLLAGRLPAGFVGPGDVVRPLGLDRFGFRLRVEGPYGDTDVRVPFPRPLTCTGQLGPAVAQLLCAARAGRVRRG
ncbi:DUF2470 domain-containing protein [Blastococcus sp. VKM Ac-2987]|uniref:DUF2470 domain-containing protein n=1 Tax=Blastococcus sp. VKM Ac-2987 TaxID=3004141 RepID=UPI0022AB4FC8|nr:DUF2470 domain-containing protein [Blastococcus sp. VKM Ac-2987]MCZ2860887.1 DUF2470 domain-containing protein [Blastococcus sp. VKM Ac-2987]